MHIEIDVPEPLRPLAREYADAYLNAGNDNDEVFIHSPDDENFIVSINGEEREYTPGDLRTAITALRAEGFSKKLKKSDSSVRETLLTESKRELSKTLKEMVEYVGMRELGRLGIGKALYTLEILGNRLRAAGAADIKRKRDILTVAERYFKQTGHAFPSPSERSKGLAIYTTYALNEPDDIEATYKSPDYCDDSGQPIPVKLRQTNSNNLYAMHRLASKVNRTTKARIVAFCHQHNEAVVAAAARWLNDDKMAERLNELVEKSRSYNDGELLEFLREQLQTSSPTQRIALEGSLYENVVKPYLERYGQFTGNASVSEAIESALVDLLNMSDNEFIKWLYQAGRIDEERYKMLLDVAARRVLDEA